MTSTSRAWIAAATIGAMEALKDQGFCRWSYTVRSLQQHTKNRVRSYAQARKLSSSPAMASNKAREEKVKQSDESMRKVIYLSTWGPY